MCFGKSKSQAAAVQTQTVDNSQAVADNQAQVDRQITEQKTNNEALIAASDRQQAAALAESQRQANEQIGIQQQAMSMQSAALAAQRDQASAMFAAQQKAAKDAADAIFNVSQKAKNPNVAQIMRDNLKANSTGVTSTMLTGTAGVDNASLTLGKNKLLGA